MISIVRLWESLGEKTKTSTAGYQTQASFNNNIAEVVMSLMNTLSPYYSVNQTVKDLLAPFVVSDVITTDTSGFLEKPDNYYRYLDSIIDGNPVYPIALNEVGIVKKSAVRTPSVAKGIYFSYQEDNLVKYLPEEELEVNFKYLRNPEIPEITLTPTSDEDGDYLVPTSVTDLDWNDNAFEFILYMMLNKYGFEMKEDLILAYANAGIQLETSKI